MKRTIFKHFAYGNVVLYLGTCWLRHVRQPVPIRLPLNGLSWNVRCNLSGKSTYIRSRL